MTTGAHLRFAGTPPETQRAALAEIVRADATLMKLLACVGVLSLPQWRLVSGAIYQTVWNALTGRQRGHGIKDYDICYFDDDVSWDAEDEIIRRVEKATSHLSLPVETRNQARVHLWFEGRFGSAYAPLASTDESLTRYAAVVHAVGVRLERDGSIDIAAPFGLEDLFGFVVRPNGALPNEKSFDDKAARVRTLWPQVTIIPWRDAPSR